MLTDLQTRTIKAIVNIFETGQVLGDYATVTAVAGDPGGLTYGRSQTSHKSGGLHELLRRYVATPGAEFVAELTPYLAMLKAGKNPGPPRADRYLHNLLRAAADSPVMQGVQDRFFDRAYWRPARRDAAGRGIETPLGIAVVYDSRIHGSWRKMRKRTNASAGKIDAVGEREWIAAYVDARRDWLAGHNKKILRKTVYRMEAFKALIEIDAWALDLPLAVSRREISKQTLFAAPKRVFDGPPFRSRALARVQPLMRGADVRRAQLALTRPGIDIAIEADGWFGQQSEAAVKAFQAQRGMAETGIVDGPVFDALGA